MSVLVELSKGVPPILRMDPNTNLCEGLRVEVADSSFMGTVTKVQDGHDGAYYIGVEWDNSRAPQGCMCGGGMMDLTAFMVCGPRPPKEERRA